MVARHKKTLKQKIIADYRHNAYILENKNIPIVNTSVIASSVNSAAHSYSYVYKDILKTTVLTLSIVGAQMILFFLLKNHVIALPIIKY